MNHVSSKPLPTLQWVYSSQENSIKCVNQRIKSSSWIWFIPAKILRLTFVTGVKIRNTFHNCYQNIPLPAQALAMQTMQGRPGWELHLPGQTWDLSDVVRSSNNGIKLSWYKLFCRHCLDKTIIDADLGKMKFKNQMNDNVSCGETFDASDETFWCHSKIDGL